MESSVDCMVDWIAKSWTQLSDFHFHFGELRSYKPNSTKKKKKLMTKDDGEEAVGDDDNKR